MNSKSIITVGGTKFDSNNEDSSRSASNTVDIVSLDTSVSKKLLPKLPSVTEGSSLLIHDKKLITCGGVNQKQECLQLKDDKWIPFSNLNHDRQFASVASTESKTILFGGQFSNTFEYLAKDSNEWETGLNEIPQASFLSTFSFGCAVTISEDTILLIGGRNSEKRILRFNVLDQTFEEVPTTLNFGRRIHSCMKMPESNSVLVTGGLNEDGEADSADMTEILTIKDSGDIIAEMSTPMNTKRYGHGMGLLTIHGEERIAVIGGVDENKEFLDSIETYDPVNQKWESSDMKMSVAKGAFGYITVDDSFFQTKKEIPKCGRRHFKGGSDSLLKVGMAEFGEFPYTCIIMKKNSASGVPTILGGASLISPNVALTAAKVLEFG